MTRSPLRLRRTLILTTCLTAAAALTPFAAQAADANAAAETAPTSTVAPVVITAERRAVDIQRAPLAVSSVSAKTLDQSGVITVAGLNGIVPSLEVTKASGFENLVSIRGIGSETPENSLTTVPGVSEFVDGVYITNTISLDQTLFDIDNIQVLRGPQGALYGESSIGGAILINTQQPHLGAFDAKGDLTLGDYGLSRERAELNFPLGDDVAVRFSAQKYDHGGFTRDVLIPGFTLDDEHDLSGKAALLWRPTQNFSATFTVQGFYADQNGDAQKNINEFAFAPNPRIVFQDYPAHFRLNNDLAHLNLEWDQPGFIMKSVTGYQYLAHLQREDSSRSAFSLIGQYDDVAAWNTWVDNWTEEFDVLSPPGQKLEWIAGVFGLSQHTHQFIEEFECTTPAIFGGCAPPPTGNPQPPAPSNPIAPPPGLQLPGAIEPGNLAYGNDSHAIHWAAAVFGQITYHLSDTVRLTAGLRYNHDFEQDPSFNFSAFGKNFQNNKTATNELTWRFVAEDDLTPDNMIYGSISRGYKPGGANGTPGFILPLVFKPETNDALELGSKNYFFDKSLRFNVSAFYYIHHDFQYIETDPIPFAAGITNIPRIDNYGIEFEGNYVGLDGHLHMDGSLALERGRVVGSYKTLDSTIANAIEGPNFTGGFFGPCAFFSAFFSPTCWNAVLAHATDIRGKEPPDTPNVSGSFAISYRIDTPVGPVTPRAQVIYRGSEWARIFNEPILDKVPAYTVTNVYLEWAPVDSHLLLSVTATNLFNVNGINSRYTDPFGTFTTSNQYIPPRQVYGTVAFQF